MSREALAGIVATVHDYVCYLQRLGVTELPLRHVTCGMRSAAGEISPAVVRLQRLAEAVHDCRKCRLHQGRTQVVFGTGNPEADLVFVGEAPGEEEDRQGEPFVGPAGELLTRIIEAIGLHREQVYIHTTAIHCQTKSPPAGRFYKPSLTVCARGSSVRWAPLRPRRCCRPKKRFHACADASICWGISR
jgi:Uracil DNA glycosylase superfamily